MPASLPQLIESAGLALPLLGRVSGFMLAAPPFSNKLAPRSVKTAVAIALWLALCGSAPALSAAPSEAPLWGNLLAQTFFGIALGSLIRFFFLAFDYTAELIANGMGLSFPGQFNPAGVQTAGPTAALSQMLGIFTFINADGLESLIGLLVGSFQAIPDPSNLLWLKAWAQAPIVIFRDAMWVSITAALPMWGSLLLANLMLLISSRLAGGLNLMNSGLPVLVALGIALLCLFIMPISAHISAEILVKLTHLSF